MESQSSSSANRYKNALLGASALHIGIGLSKLLLPKISPIVAVGSSVGLLPPLLVPVDPNQHDNHEANMEYRQYAWFIVFYGIVLGLYRSFGSFKFRRLAITVETFRVSCYVFVRTMENFDFDAEETPGSFQKSVWQLTGIIGLVSNICALCDQE